MDESLKSVRAIHQILIIVSVTVGVFALTSEPPENIYERTRKGLEELIEVTASTAFPTNLVENDTILKNKKFEVYYGKRSYKSNPSLVYNLKVNELVDCFRDSTKKLAYYVPDPNYINDNLKSLIDKSDSALLGSNLAYETSEEASFFKSDCLKVELRVGHLMENLIKIEALPSLIQKGKASFYSKKFNGRKTYYGELVSAQALEGAHKTLPLNALVEVTNLDNQRSVIVRTNDQRSFSKGRIIDLTHSASQALGVLSKGVANLSLSLLTSESTNLGTAPIIDSALIKKTFFCPVALGGIISIALSNNSKYSSYGRELVNETELLPVLREIDSLSLSESLSYLKLLSSKKQLEGNKEGMEIVGLKIASKAAVIIGPLIVLCLFIYLLSLIIHLNEIYLTDRGSIDTFPWLGLFDNKMSKILMKISVYILPLFSVLLIVFYSGLSLFSKLGVACLYLTTFTVISYYVIKYSASLRRIINRTNLDSDTIL